MTDSTEATELQVTRAKPRDSGDILWEDSGAKSDLTGAALIAELVTRLPKKPGVYRMMNAAGDVLYVGKAKSLRNRVQNYARGIGHGGNHPRGTIAETTQMEFVTTHTETEALLL